jgi:hypothetical protein
MTLRQPHQDALLPAGDAARIRQVLVACPAAVPGRSGLRPAVRRSGAGHGRGRGPEPGARRSRL